MLTAACGLVHDGFFPLRILSYTARRPLSEHTWPCMLVRTYKLDLEYRGTVKMATCTPPFHVMAPHCMCECLGVAGLVLSTPRCFSQTPLNIKRVYTQHRTSEVHSQRTLSRVLSIAVWELALLRCLVQITHVTSHPGGWQTLHEHEDSVVDSP